MQGLEQFCLLAKTSRSMACVALIQQVMTHKKIFVVGELLEMPNVQALRGTEHEAYLELLEIFAYGTVNDYTSNEKLAGKLDDQQLNKLRKLSLVTYAAEKKVLPYDTLLNNLQMKNVRELEDLIIDSICSGLLQGKLNQKLSQLQVLGTSARDVKTDQLGDMMSQLENWCGNSEALIKSLDFQISASEVKQSDMAKLEQEMQDKMLVTICTQSDRDRKMGDVAMDDIGEGGRHYGGGGGFFSSMIGGRKGPRGMRRGRDRDHM